MQKHMSDINWPHGFERTPEEDREANNKFDVTLARAFSDLEKELDRLGADDYDYEFDARQRKRDKRPYSRARPDDPSFVVKWTMGGEQYAAACDRYTKLRDNVRAVGLYLNEKRKMENRPVTTGESEFTNLRLPSGDEVVAPDRTPRQVLGVGPDAGRAEIVDAFRERVKETHPDRGGNAEEHQRVLDAREELLG